MFTFKLIEDTVDSPREEIIKVSSRDILRWERRSNKNSFGNIAKDLKIGDLYALGWLAAIRLKLVERDVSLDAFIDSWELELVSGPEDEEAEAFEDPTS